MKAKLAICPFLSFGGSGFHAQSSFCYRLSLALPLLLSPSQSTSPWPSLPPFFLFLLSFFETAPLFDPVFLPLNFISCFRPRFSSFLALLPFSFQYVPHKAQFFWCFSTSKPATFSKMVFTGLTLISRNFNCCHSNRHPNLHSNAFLFFLIVRSFCLLH